MAYSRRDVWSFDDPWNETIDWYEKAVGELKSRPIDDVTSWLSLAAMHGIRQDAWKAHGYLAPDQILPDLFATLWNQCQHQSWFFLPWHRGYLASFEKIVRDAVVKLGGPADWALPYWNYNGTRPRSIELPDAFGQAQRDGRPNSLFVSARFGTDGRGHVDIDPSMIDLGALLEGDFSDDATGGFAGPGTFFSNQGNINGLLEGSPHNNVHGLVGGQSVPQPQSWDQVGLMSTPVLAALDPIFWLHHANIDRLWEIWLKRDPQNQNSHEASWLEGPPATGRSFLFPDPDGVVREAQVRDIADARKLGYGYDDTSDPLPGKPSRHSKKKGASLLSNVLDAIMPGPSKASREFAASEGRLQLGHEAGEVQVRIDAGSKPKGSATLQDAGLGIAPPPPRVYLSLDGIQSRNDAVVMKIYVAAPASSEAAGGSEHFVGSVSMFGASQASDPHGLHGGVGITQALDITDSYDALVRAGVLDQGELTVKFRKATDMSDLSDVSVGKVRLIHKP